MSSLHDVGTAVISARSQWNRTGIRLTAREKYLLTAKGCWVDFFLIHRPPGDPSQFTYMRWFERYRRMPTTNWFALIGTVNCDLSTAFVIGESKEITGIEGELTCFANDVPCMYWNNWGHVELLVEQYAHPG